MTRKDYVKIAAVLAENMPAKETISQVMCTAFADMLSADNPNFDRARFYKACGMEESND